MGHDLTIVNAARASTGKESTTFEEKDKKLLDFLIRSGHTSTLEHNLLTVRCKVPLFVSKQHMRHRTQSYNEISHFNEYDLVIINDDLNSTYQKIFSVIEAKRLQRYNKKDLQNFVNNFLDKNA